MLSSHVVRIFGRELVVIVCFFLATLVLGAALAPVLFKLGHAVAGLLERNELAEGSGLFAWLHKVAIESGFSRYFNRGILIAALICLWPTFKALRLRREEMGFVSDPRWKARWLGGFGLAAGMLLQLGMILALVEHADLSGGLFRLKGDLDETWVKVLRKALVPAIAVSFLEEALFRGALTGLVARASGKLTTWISVAVIFSAVHFLKPPESAKLAADEVTWTSGFWIVGQIFAQFGNLHFFLAEFITLLVVGLILGWARMRTGSLWLPIGLHAGWVFGVFFFRGVFSGTKSLKAGEYLPWIGDNLRTGLLPLVALAITAVLLAIWMRKECPKRRPG